MFFAFITSPFPSHLGQMLLAVKELLRRGHRVEIWGDESSEPVAKRVGAGFQIVPLNGGLSDNITSFNQRPQDYYAHFAFPLVFRQFPRVLELCELDPPDVIHSNSRIYTAAIASRLTGIPCSNHCCSGWSFGLVPEDLFGFRRDDNDSPRKREMMVAMNRAFHREIDSLFEQIVTRPLGIASVENVLGLVSDRCVLVLSCDELSNPRLAALSQTVCTGPLMDAEQVFNTPSDYCYVSLGTWPLEPEATINLYRIIISGIPQKYRVIVGLGGRFEPSDLTIEDERISILKYAPQEAMIRNAAAVICHGGCQTIHEALYYGKPLVMLPPNLAEPQELSQTVARKGAGILSDYCNIDSNDVQQAVNTVLAEDSYRCSAESIGQSLRKAGGLNRAVESLERLGEK